jgi:hypothetical protein
MRTFGKDEFEQFLAAVDQALTHPVDVIVIGGTAAALHYGVTRRTHDIDTCRPEGSGRGRREGTSLDRA